MSVTQQEEIENIALNEDKGRSLTRSMEEAASVFCRYLCFVFSCFVLIFVPFSVFCFILFRVAFLFCFVLFCFFFCFVLFSLVCFCFFVFCFLLPQVQAGHGKKTILRHVPTFLSPFLLCAAHLLQKRKSLTCLLSE